MVFLWFFYGIENPRETARNRRETPEKPQRNQRETQRNREKPQRNQILFPLGACVRGPLEVIGDSHPFIAHLEGHFLVSHLLKGGKEGFLVKWIGFPVLDALDPVLLLLDRQGHCLVEGFGELSDRINHVEVPQAVARGGGGCSFGARELKSATIAL
jgi:hypothetical protein